MNPDLEMNEQLTTDFKLRRAEDRAKSSGGERELWWRHDQATEIYDAIHGEFGAIYIVLPQT